MPIPKKTVPKQTLTPWRSGMRKTVAPQSRKPSTSGQTRVAWPGEKTQPTRTSRQQIVQTCGPSPVPWPVQEQVPEPEPSLFSFWKPSITQVPARSQRTTTVSRKTRPQRVSQANHQTRSAPTPVPWPVGGPIQRTSYVSGNSPIGGVRNPPKPVPWPGGNRRAPQKTASMSSSLPAIGLRTGWNHQQATTQTNSAPKPQTKSQSVPWPSGRRAVSANTQAPTLGFNAPPANAKDIEVLPISIPPRSQEMPSPTSTRGNGSMRDFANAPPVVELQGGDAMLIRGRR